MADQPPWLVDNALRDAALHDLEGILGADQAQRLYRNDVGFHAAGWWPTSKDLNGREREQNDMAALIEINRMRMSVEEFRTAEGLQ